MVNGIILLLQMKAELHLWEKQREQYVLLIQNIHMDKKHHSQSANNSANFFQFPHPDCPHQNHPLYCNYPPVSSEIRGQKIRTAWEETTWGQSTKISSNPIKTIFIYRKNPRIPSTNTSATSAPSPHGWKHRNRKTSPKKFT